MSDGRVRVGFIGLGVMGQPMALNLARAGMSPLVWNRTSARCEPVVAAGARPASGPGSVFAASDVVVLMLADEAAVDTVLNRGSPAFGSRVNGRTLVHMGTVAASYSRALHADVVAAGGRYVEAPVSGSRGPAEAGDLVAMVAGDDSDIERIRPVLAPMCAEVFTCGPVPRALSLKFAVNLFLITMVTGLAEAFNYADGLGIDRGLLAAVLNAGPMSSAVSRAKADKLVRGDFAVQAAIFDVLKNSRLVADEARRTGIAAPLLDVCAALYGETLELGHGNADMAAVINAIHTRTAHD